MGKDNLAQAKRNKNDEFYTQLVDIEKEMEHYTKHFKGKTIFLNCDDPQTSEFWLFFSLNFKYFGLKKLIATHFNRTEPTYKLEMTTYKNTIRTELKQNGDFRSGEAIELLKQSDIIITNPPFSLFREYVAQLMEYDKKFIIIGSLNAVSYKEIFPLLKDNKIWLGNTAVKKFIQPDRTIKTFGNINWFTNIEHSKRNEEIILCKYYNPNEYPKYDNYNAINIDKVKDIPVDYYEPMGVPITFMSSFNPKQFEIINIDRVLTKELTGSPKRFLINGKEKYARIIIKRKGE